MRSTIKQSFFYPAFRIPSVFFKKDRKKKKAKTSYFMARIHYHFLNLSEAHDLMAELLQESQN